MVVLLIVLIVILISFTTSTIVVWANGNQMLSYILLGFNLLFSIPTIFTIVLNIRHSESARKSIASMRFNRGEKKFNEFVNKNAFQVYNKFKVIVDDQSFYIDHLLVTPKGVFIINNIAEVGHINGKVENKKWEVTVEKGRIKKSIDNPYYLSQICLDFVKNLFKLRLNVFAIAVVYGGSFKNIKNIHVLNMKSFIKTYNKLSVVLRENDLKEINEIATKYLAKPIYTYKEKLENLICPECGKPLLFRHTKKGDYLECSDNPKCKFFLKI